MTSPLQIDSLHVDALSVLLDCNVAELPDPLNHAVEDFVQRIGGIANAVLAVQMLSEME